MNEQTDFASHRLAFIDILRGLAVVWMIETHVVDVALAPIWKSGWLYENIYLSNGFVAVGFVFCAGAGFWIAAERKFVAYTSFSQSFWVYLRRLGFILLMAYWMNLPAFSWDFLIQNQPQSFVTVARCDVLHVIAYASLVALLIVCVTRSMKLSRLIFVVLALAIFFLAPWVWSKDSFSVLPLFVASLFTKYPLAKFPLFPWTGYFFAGASLTGFFLASQNKKRFALVLILLALLTPSVVFFIKDLPFNYLGLSNTNEWWYSSPGHSLYRMSRIIFLYALLFLVEEKFGAQDRVSRFLQSCGQESLFIYIFHIMIVYTSIFNVGLRYFTPGILSPWQVVGVTILITAGCYALAMVWHYYKKNSPYQARMVLATLILLFLSLFFLIPAKNIL